VLLTCSFHVSMATSATTQEKFQDCYVPSPREVNIHILCVHLPRRSRGDHCHSLRKNKLSNKTLQNQEGIMLVLFEPCHPLAKSQIVTQCFLSLAPQQGLIDIDQIVRFLSEFTMFLKDWKKRKTGVSGRECES